jgi:hypothetical protein
MTDDPTFLICVVIYTPIIFLLLVLGLTYIMEKCQDLYYYLLYRW